MINLMEVPKVQHLRQMARRKRSNKGLVKVATRFTHGKLVQLNWFRNFNKKLSATKMGSSHNDYIELRAGERVSPPQIPNMEH